MNPAPGISTVIICATLLSACTPGSDHPAPDITAQTAPTRLPAGIVRVTGGGNTRVAKAGQANCQPPSAAETAGALATTNALRARHGLAPLRLDATLQRAAQGHACDMARLGLMGHGAGGNSGPAARIKALGYRPRITAENIAAGHFSLDRVMGEWAASPGHRRNVTITGLRDFGIGRAVAADGRSVFWAAIYAEPARPGARP
ncbi:MAG: CAP domain-containing protein [Paracoccus sp. (in: a-proteobacteria)]|nr:CAP domain-containing protein [Paracoccus sp. (in: a-proteobacteria)]